MLHAWLNEPGVVRWWEGDDVSWEGVQRDYGPGSDPTVEHWIAVEDDRDVGWIQCYAVADSPEERDVWWSLGLDRTAAAIDYLVADPAARGRGLGSRMIATFVHDVVFARHPDWTQVAAAPYDGNVASWRALEKAGFRSVGIVEEPDDDPCRVMVLDRTAP